MTSLMQEFAEARQERLQDHVNFLSRQQLAREQRQQDLQVQSEATAKYLAHAEQTRLEREQGRHAIAAKALASRQEEFQNRASQVSTYLSNLNVDRTKQAAEDGEERAQEVRTRTFTRQESVMVMLQGLQEDRSPQTELHLQQCRSKISTKRVWKMPRSHPS